MRSMKRLQPPLVLLILLTALGFPPATHAQQTASPAGYWEGVIRLPNVELAIRVEIEPSAGVWTGAIDIPPQGLRGFKLGDVTVKGANVSFAMPGIPGEPKFAGKLAGDAKTIRGDFSQGGQTFPFQLDRKAKPAGATGETPAKRVPGKGLAGHWQGSLKPSPVIELRLVLEITNSPAGEPGGVIIIVDQGGVSVPLTALVEKEGTVRLEAQSVGGTFDGKLSDDGSEIAGEWRQGGGAMPLVFKRLEKAPDFARPQDPKKPYPYEEEEVKFENAAANVTLAGTLTWPSGPGPHPAVVLISGSGPQDRDEAIMGHRPFLVLADHLTRQGIAVLRYDDRGVGRSTGKFAEATHDDFVEDALAAVDWLKTRKEIDPERIGLAGHSEGGIVAPLAAAQKPSDIAFIVLLAGVGVPMDELLARQGRDIMRVMGANEEMMAKSDAAQRESFRLLREESDAPALEKKLRELLHRQLAELTEEQRNALGLSEAMMESQLQVVLNPWFKQLLNYDPRPALRRVKCPVLAVNGEKDIQVAAKENLAAIREALAGGGNTRVKTVELPGLNHLFQTCATGAVAEYGQIEETFHPAALKLVSDWIREQSGIGL